MKYQRPEIKGECPEMNVNNHKTDRKQKGYRKPAKKREISPAAPPLWQHLPDLYHQR